MKKRLFSVVFALAGLALATDYPAYNGYINDFAGRLTQSERQSLEWKVQQYKQQTTNEIAVAILPTIGNEDRDAYANGLFRYWGVGVQGKNNGVLLMWVPKDTTTGLRRIRIEVGRGLEPFLTDAWSAELRDQIVEHFKNLDNDRTEAYQGISLFVDAVTQKLGTQPYDQLLTNKQQQERAEQEQSEKESAEAAKLLEKIFMFVLLLAAAVIGIAILAKVSSAITKAVAERKRKTQLRVTLFSEARDIKMTVQGICFDLATEVSRLRTILPLQRDQQALDKAQALSKTEENHSLSELDHGFSLINENPDQAAKIIRQISTNNVRETLNLLKQREQDYTDAVENSTNTVNSKKTAVELAKQQLAQLQTQGYRVNIETEFAAVVKLLAECDSFQYAQPADPENAVKKAEEAGKLAKNIISDHKKVFEERIATEREIPRTQARLKKLADLTAQAQVEINNLKNNYPAGVWEPVNTQVKKLITQLPVMSQQLNSAQSLNSMENQEFQKAAQAVATINAYCQMQEGLCQQPAQINQKQLEAKNGLSRVRAQVTEAIEKASRKASDSDVSPGTKFRLNGLAVVPHNNSGLVDWVTTNLVYNNILGEADDIYRTATREIEEAENERRRAAQRAADDAAYQSSYNSTNDSPSFGGGDSGGGGAGRDY